MKRAEISKYRIFWVEISSTKGVVTKADKIKMKRFWTLYNGNSKEYVHFGSKDRAINWINSIAGKLSKTYECRLFTDAQFAKRDESNNYAVPFTIKQFNEVYYI